GVKKDDPFDFNHRIVPNYSFVPIHCHSDEAGENAEDLYISAILDWSSRDRYVKLGSFTTNQFTWGQCESNLESSLIRCAGQDSSKAYEFEFDLRSDIDTNYS